MSETYNKIQLTIKDAMKDGNATKRDVLRMVVSDIKNKTVNEGKEITEEGVVSCLKKFAKQEEDAIASAKTANRNDLADKATLELSIVSEFLPKMLSEDMQKKICEMLIVEARLTCGGKPTMKDFGFLMKNVPSNCDKGFCSKVLRELLK